MSNPENRSSAYEGGAKRPSDTLDKDPPNDERGKRAAIDRDTGEVLGSGSQAGGGGTPGEDYDNDPMGGGGAEPTGGPRDIEHAEHGRRDKYEGYNH